MRPEPPKQGALFGAGRPEQRTLALDESGELANRARRAVDELDASARALLNAAREAQCARTAAAGGPREYALVEAVRILEAARVACLNARTLLAIDALRPVTGAPESEE